MASAWEVVSFKKYVSDKRKITRKKHSMETDIYPAEGHRSVIIKDHQSQYLYCVGGSRHDSETVWEMSKDIIKFEFHVGDRDMYLLNTDIIKSESMSGANLPALTYPAVCGWAEGGRASILIHGGLSITEYKPIMDMYLISNRLKDKHSTCKVYLGSQPESTLLQNAARMEGDIPAARYGHTMVTVGSNKFLLFGGSCFSGRSGRRVRLKQLFSARQADDAVYQLTINGECYPKILM
jgi:hypothetical protein